MRAFVRLSRPKFLVGGFVGGAFGTAMAIAATGRFDARSYAIAQTAITAFHLMTHYANDYFDRACDARAIRTPYSGGSGALVDGTLAPQVALIAAALCALAGGASLVALTVVARAPLAALLGVGIALGAWTYSAPPLRLLTRGLGELDTALVVAVLVPLCAYAAQGAPPTLASLASTLPGAAAMFAMMLAVEYPDIVADTAGRKRNVLVRFGAGVGARLGVGVALAVYPATALAVALGAPPTLGLFEALTLPLACGLVRALAAWRRPEYARDEALAARGVAYFFVVIFFALLAYAPVRAL